MTERDDFILSLARRVYQEKPFYRWFYDNASVDVEQADVQDIPFLTKKDLFRYKEETGQEHYLPMSFPESEIIQRTTSGTTGPPLPIPWLKTEWFFSSQNILLNFIPQIKGRPRFLMAVNPDEEERAKAIGSVVVRAARHRLADAPYILGLIKTHRPNVFVDNSPGLWFTYMLDHGLDPRKAGIQLVLAQPNQKFAQTVESLGLKYASLFGCTEAGVFGYSHNGIAEEYHLSDAGPTGMPDWGSNRTGLLGGVKIQMLTKLFPCDCYQGVDLQNLMGKRDIRIRTESGQLATTGVGSMVITCANSLSPLVKYLNGDVVEILPTDKCACGFSGRSMRFQHREHEVQVPYVGINGTVIKLEWIARYLEGEGFKRVFPVYYPLDSVLRIVVTFVEDQDVDAPCLDYTLAPEILASACSIDLELARNCTRDLLFYPAIRVPHGAIPIRDQASLKSRLFLDAVNGLVPDEYRTVLALVQQLVDLPAVLRAGSWFLMPPVREAQSVEAP